MNDTNAQILNLFIKDSSLSSSQVHIKTPSVSLVTIKRRLAELVKLGLLTQSGAGRSVTYRLSKIGVLLKPVDVGTYLSSDPDTRTVSTSFDYSLFEPPYVSLFSVDEITKLDKTTAIFRANAQHSDINMHNKELLRYIIEFSWKTSQIEGNTYDLLSTERLLRYGEKSNNNTEYETQMILNQKEAMEFVIENLDAWQAPTISLLEQLHTIVGKKLDISRNLRRGLVGITGTNYRPIDNEFQIREALELLFSWIKQSNNAYEKGLLSVLGISYIQPFVDGNKRTSRLLSNAILLSLGYAPLSYRSVDDKAYKEATLVFYEQSSMTAFKQLFIEQYVFAATNYNISVK